MKNTKFLLIKETFSEFSKDDVSRLAAAMAYYTVFSLAPLLIIAISLAGYFFGEDAVRGHLMQQISGLIGAEGGAAIETMVKGAYQAEQGTLATVIGVVILLFGATGLFVQLQDALDRIWGVKSVSSEGILGFLFTRWLSFTMILIIALILLVSLFLSAVLSFLTENASHYLTVPGYMLELTNISISFVISSLLFAMVFKILPNIHILWKNVWVGAIFTSLLFSAGKYLIGLYLGQAAVSSGYGAAGSLIIVMMWSYYSALIILIGAEFTKVYARNSRHTLTPKPGFEMIK